MYFLWRIGDNIELGCHSKFINLNHFGRVKAFAFYCFSGGFWCVFNRWDSCYSKRFIKCSACVLVMMKPWKLDCLMFRAYNTSNVLRESVCFSFPWLLNQVMRLNEMLNEMWADMTYFMFMCWTLFLHSYSHSMPKT